MTFKRVRKPVMLMSAAIGLCLSGVGMNVTLAGEPAAIKDGATPLIPRASIFGNPDRAGSQLSHDGKWISYLAPVNGVLNVWVAPADDLAKASAITSDKKRGIRQYFWAYTNDQIIYLQDQGGDENWRIYSVNVADNAVKDLTPMEGVAAQVQATSAEFPDEILVSLNNRNPQYHDVHRVNIRTGEMKLVKQNDEYAGFVTDEQYNIRFAAKQNSDGGMQWVKFSADGTAEPFETVGMEDSLTTSINGFDKSGRTVYMVDSRGRDTAGLFARDVATNKSTLLAEDARADAGATIVRPSDNKIQAVGFNYERTEWKVLDSSIQPDLDYLKTVADGDLAIASRTLDDSRWLVGYVMDNGPTRVYLYDRPGGKPGQAKFLYTNRTSLEGLPLAKMHPVTIKSRDGLNLVSFLTLPLGSEKGTLGRPDKPLPMVLLVHGGPWARDTWGYNPYHQWLANRGYAVLSVNFRGSTGLGKNFLNAGNLEWAAAMHNDLLDATAWAVKQGIADKSKVAIMGGSYGGYATLVGLTFTPGEFACGVDIVGPSNIVTLLETIPPYWAPLVEQFKKRVGDHTTEAGRAFLESRSPLTFVDRIEKPLLIGQGANDPRVKQREADQIVAAMQGKGLPVTYVLFPDEGHGFARPENSMSFNAVTESFLARHLGGRAEPIGGDVAKSTAEVRAGADQVPGLAEAVGGGAKPK